MEIKLLCFGDVVGGAGRHVLGEALADLTRAHKIDLVVVNAENAAAGSGLTPPLAQKIRSYGVNVITMGDHVYRRRESIPLLETSADIVRPANLPTGAPGREFVIHETRSGHRAGVISLLGRMFMKPVADCPFRTVDRVLNGMPRDVKIIVVDMHAEATSEKIAMGWHLDGRVSVLFGTHTHVQTADERILPKGTAYITDLGMTGPHDSVLGRLKERVVSSMISSVPSKLDVASGDPVACGMLVTVDTASGKAVAVERVRFKGSGSGAEMM